MNRILYRETAAWARGSTYLRVLEDVSSASIMTARLGEIVDTTLDAIDAVLAIHPVEEYRQYPASGLVDDPNDPPVTGCPMCETVGECLTRRTLSDDIGVAP